MAFGFPHRAGRCRAGRSSSNRPRVVGTVEIRRDFWTGDGALFHPGAAELPPVCGPLSFQGNACSMSASKSTINQWIKDFHTVQRGIDPEELCFRSRRVELVDVCNAL